jgi:hypothetical protein
METCFYNYECEVTGNDYADIICALMKVTIKFENDLDSSDIYKALNYVSSIYGDRNTCESRK